MKIDINEPVIEKIAKVAEESNVEIYAVGGFVRDKLLGKKSKDIDFVVVGDGLKFANDVAKYYNLKKVIEFKRFETAKIPFKGQEVEVVSAREEIYSENSRKPLVKKATLKSDLERRDFTINAMAVKIYGEDKGEVVDHFNGLEDLQNGIIKTPLDPFITYSEDPLRMLRAIRFSSRYDYMIDENSFNAIKSNIERLKIISVERISDEFFKIMESDGAVNGLEKLDICGVLDFVFPELTALKGVDIIQGKDHKDIFKHTMKVVENVCISSSSMRLRLAALFHDIGKPNVKKFSLDDGFSFWGHEDFGSKMVKKIGRRMKWSVELIDYLSKIIKLHHRPINLTTSEVSDSGVRRLLFEGGEDVEDLMILCKSDITTSSSRKLDKFLRNYEVLEKKLIDVEERDRLRNFQPPVNGEEIMEILNITPGKEVGRIKNFIVESILNGEIKNERSDILGILQKIKSGILDIN
ncbi:MAG: HD domain-containing protein [Candidatus Delongbacteria bacterium]|nr:HD domain-containing protein [Candidatus Delongbacteria bacterium]MBN2834417.1 HD domain-containing protein [Candidatus Delongbacteria bacterium]